MKYKEDSLLYFNQCSCMESYYERKAILAGMNNNPVFPENIEFMRKFKYGT